MGAPELEYSSFALNLPEADLPRLLEVLDAVPPARLRQMQRRVIAVRDLFVYKDLFSPYRPALGRAVAPHETCPDCA